MANHTNRSTSAKIGNGFVIQLNSGRLWRNLGASDAAIFMTRENAELMMSGFSDAPALANPKVLRLAEYGEEGAKKIGGYWTAEV